MGRSDLFLSTIVNSFMNIAFVSLDEKKTLSLALKLSFSLYI